MHSPRLLLAWSLGVAMTATDDTTGDGRGRGRWLIALLIVGITLDLLVSLALGALAVQAKRAADTAHIARVAAYESCLVNNQAKQADLVRWEKVLNLVDTMPTNPEVQTFVAGVRSANETADKQIDCGVPVH